MKQKTIADITAFMQAIDWLYLLSKENIMRIHPSKEVEKALIRLNDALCTYERATSRESVLILREVDGFVHRSVSGKPCYLDDVPDYQLMLNIIGH